VHAFDAALQTSGLFFGRAAKSPIESLLDQLGPDARAWWTTYDPSRPADPGIALSSGNVQSWTDQIGGYVISAPAAGQRPAYATDGSNFGGRSVVQTNQTGTKYLTGAVSGLLTAGQRAYVLMVGRYRGATGVPVALQLDVVSAGDGLYHYLTGGQFRAFHESTFAGMSADTAQHVWEWWLDGTSLNHKKESTLVQTATSASLAANIGTVTVGNVGAGGGISSFSCAEIIVLASYPGATIEAQLMAAERAKWAI
jgi:hypothetical protein